MVLSLDLLVVEASASHPDYCLNGHDKEKTLVWFSSDSGAEIKSNLRNFPPTHTFLKDTFEALV